MVILVIFTQMAYIQTYSMIKLNAMAIMFFLPPFQTWDVTDEECMEDLAVGGYIHCIGCV